jgi:hypothetical protein
MIIKKIWFDRKGRQRHAGKHIEVHGWFLFGFIPLYIVEYRTIG